MARQSPKKRWACLGLVTTLGCAVLSESAFADQNCGEDIQKLSQRLQVENAKISNLVKASKGKKMDPAVFCSQSSGLVAAENAMMSYMVKNKEWCSIPDDALNNLKTVHAKNAGFNSQACKVAAQMKKMQEQQASGAGNNSAPQAQPLPTGPL
jgi:hypothetical protein